MLHQRKDDLHKDGTRTFDPHTKFVQSIADFQESGKRSIVENRHGIPFLTNEYWTARQRQGHSIHEISYRACFKAELPGFFISRLSRPGDVVLDPFMGRGTTPIQAQLMGRQAIGVDINPLSAFLAGPRLSPPGFANIAERLASINWNGKILNLPSELLVFYHPETLREICLIRRWLLKRATQGKLDSIDEWIRMVALNRLTGHSTGFFSTYTLPPNLAASPASQAKINAKRNQIPERRNVPAIILKKTRTLLRDSRPTRMMPGKLFAGSAEAMPFLRDGEVDLVVTSPPFMDTVQYASDNWLRCWFAGIDATSIPIAMHRKIEGWTGFIQSVLRELARVVRQGGYVAFEVGEIRRQTVELETLVLQAVRSTPFIPVCVLINQQKFTKTSNCWGISNNDAGTNSNRVVILSRN